MPRHINYTDDEGPNRAGTASAEVSTTGTRVSAATSTYICSGSSALTKNVVSPVGSPRVSLWTYSSQEYDCRWHCVRARIECWSPGW